MQSLRVPWSLWMKIVRVPMSSLESRKENQGFLDGQSWPWIKSGRVPGRLLIKTVRVPMSLLDFHEFPRVPATVSKFRSLQKTGTFHCFMSMHRLVRVSQIVSHCIVITWHTAARATSRSASDWSSAYPERFHSFQDVFYMCFTVSRGN